MRQTLAQPASFAGIGLHSGKPVTVTIDPAEAGENIRFVRSDVDVGYRSIDARYDLVTDTRLCTKLSNKHGVSIGTVEHVMAALAGCGITDATIIVDGPELPIMDGSSVVFVDGIADAGIVQLDEPARCIRVLRTVSVEKDGKYAALAPASQFEMAYSIVFDDPAIGTQDLEMPLVNGAFVSELANCRTFGHLREVEHLRAMGLAKGGSLQNAIVVDNGRVLNQEGLRRPDEFVRHKMLDAIGDLALAGAPIMGRYIGCKAGHEMTNLLLHALFDQPDAWCWDTVARDATLGLGVGPIVRSTEPAIAV